MVYVFVLIIAAFVIVKGFISPMIGIAINAIKNVATTVLALFSNPDNVNPITLFTLCFFILVALVMRDYVKVKAPMIIGAATTVIILYYTASMFSPQS